MTADLCQSSPDIPLIVGRPAPWGDLVSMLAGIASQTGDDCGVTVDGAFLSYRALQTEAQRFAGGLSARGLRREDRVCVLMQNRIEVLVTWFGTMVAGGVWVPLNTGLLGDDLHHTLKDAEPVFIVADEEGARKIIASGVAVAQDQRFVCGEAVEGFAPYAQLANGSGHPPSLTFAPSDPAVIIYTGGTTGLPKGVVLPHFAMLCGGLRYAEAFEATPKDRHFSVSPLFHAGGLTIAVLGPMMARMSTTVDRTFSLSNYWRRVREARATLINPIGVILTLLCREPESEEDRQHCVRASLGVTGQLPDGVPAAFSRRFGIEIVNIYSLSEASGALIVANRLGSEKPETNGKGWHWADVAILDKVGNTLPPGALGEITLRPRIPHTFMLGYHNNQRKTLETFANLWLHTGDLGRLDEDGWLTFVGREAHWLRRRGENISCFEVESIITQHPDLEEIAIVGVPSEIGEEDVKAFVVAKSGAEIEAAAFVRWCAARMAPFKVPRFVEFLDALPRSAAKKEVERHVLRAMPNDCAWDREKVFGRKMPSDL